MSDKILSPVEELEKYWQSKEETAELDRQATTQRRLDEEAEWLEKSVQAFKANPGWSALPDEYVATLCLWLSNNQNTLGSEWVARFTEPKAWRVMVMPNFWKESANPEPQYALVGELAERFERWKTWRRGR